jgi:hypothetical protein
MEPTPHSRAVPGTFAMFSKTKLVFPPSPVNSGGTGGLVNRPSAVSVHADRLTSVIPPFAVGRERPAAVAEPRVGPLPRPSRAVPVQEDRRRIRWLRTHLAVVERLHAERPRVVRRERHHVDEFGRGLRHRLAEVEDRGGHQPPGVAVPSHRRRLGHLPSAGDVAAADGPQARSYAGPRPCARRSSSPRRGRSRRPSASRRRRPSASRRHVIERPSPFGRAARGPHPLAR